MFSGLNTATSGIRAAQRHLAITGHNVSNAETPGFSRQRMIQNTAFNRNIGTDRAGNIMQVGMGTDWNAVHQIRNEFLDLTYRENMGRLSFYSMKVQAGIIIENFLGELHGAYNFQSVLNDMWFSIQELSGHPDGIETRSMFLATSQTFLNLAQHVYNGLIEYQMNLDAQIRGMVTDINNVVARIEELNQTIRMAEAVGDNANDYMDERHRLLDRLSEMIPLETEFASNGDVVIFSGGRTMLANGIQNRLGLRFTGSEFPFVVPVFTNSEAILRADTPPTSFTPWLNTNFPINAQRGNDSGALNALLVARGMGPANRLSDDFRPEPDGLRPDMAHRVAEEAALAISAPGSPEHIAAQAAIDRFDADMVNFELHRWSVNHSKIPNIQMNLDRIFHSVVSMINDAVTGNLVDADGDLFFADGPLDLNGNTGMPLFIRNIDMDTTPPPWPLTAPDEHPGNLRSIMTINNIRINPAFLEAGGHNLLAFSPSGAEGDNRLLLALQEVWQSNEGQYAINIGGRTFNVQDAYIRFIGQIATDVAEANSRVRASTIQVQQADNMRNAVKGVSMDEELNQMLRFQFAFQAASRVFNMIDGMIDTVVNRTGRAGL